MRLESQGVDGAIVGTPGSGSENAFRRFYLDNVSGVLGLVIALHRDRESSEEITQEAFARAWQRWDRVGQLDRPGAWVRRVALNLARSRYRRLRTEIIGRARLARRDDAPGEAVHDPGIWREVRRLPRRQAEVIVLTYVDDLDSNGVADVLRIDPATVRAHLTRARRTLEKRLEEQR